MRRLALPFVAVLLVLWPLPVGAVPVPWKNCGAPGDLLSVSKEDASAWPPRSAAPIAATATFDPATGQIANLHVVLALGTVWQLDSGPLPASLAGGFVTLPVSVPLSLAQPVPLGPVSARYVFSSPGALAPVVIATQGNLAAAVANPITSLALSFNGNPGFPLPPQVGAYPARIEMTQPGGQRVFCADITVPLAAIVSVPAPDIPALSRLGGALLAALLALAGVALLRRGGCWTGD